MTDANVEYLDERRFITNALGYLFERQRLASLHGMTFNGARNLYKELGYKVDLNFADYYDRYKRGGIAAKVVNAFPASTWRNQPVMEASKKTFVREWDKLVKRLRLYHYLERADKISGIGRYGVVLVGVRGGRPLDQEMPQLSGPDDVIYLSVYSEENAKIKMLDSDPTSRRFGLPDMYRVNLGTTNTDLGNGATNFTRTVDVHHSRLIHIAEGTGEDEVFGTPRMEIVWNYLDDLEKVVGGASEAIWRTIDRGLHVNIDKDAQLDPKDEERFDKEIDQYIHKLTRVIRTQATEIKPLGSEVPNPDGQFRVLMSLIAGATGIPQRILLGAEAGQLASDQDERNYNARVKERQKSFANPTMLEPFVDRLIGFGGLPTPGDGYDLVWPDISLFTPREHADVAARYGQAINNVSRQESLIVRPNEFRRQYLQLEQDLTDEELNEWQERKQPPAPVVPPVGEDEDEKPTDSK